MNRIRKRQNQGVPWLEEPPGEAPAWVATWYEPTKGHQRACFAFGEGALFESSESAFEAAKLRQAIERTKWGKVAAKRVLGLVYEQSGNLNEVAQTLGISYPTAVKWVREAGIAVRNQGYNPPQLDLTGQQCRVAREYLNYTRDEMAIGSDVGKTALSRFEQGKSLPRRTTLSKIKKFFNTRQVIFLTDGVTFIDTSNNFVSD